MLEPEGRQPLLDALKPPPGFVLDRAVGTSYSLDLLALLTAPLAFALFDRVSADGDKLDVDPIALLEAVRRHADQIDIFCQAGHVAPMKEHRPIVAYLERSVHAVVSPNPSAIFHPKIWLLRYRAGTGERSYRFLCLSRNLTFDRSWDTLLRLDGVVRPGSAVDPRPLGEFVRCLPVLALNPLEPDRVESLNALSDELADVTFSLPDGFRSARFWPVGHDSEKRWPLDGRIDRLLTISPFLTVPMVQRLSSQGRNHVLVSRPESLDLVGANAVERFAEVLTLSTTALVDPEGQLDEQQPVDEAVAESTASELQGLHAKCYVADAGSEARIWTGSANATDAAFGGNVEFLVELTGPKRLFGVEATLAQRPGEPSFRSILEEYMPATAEPRELSVGEELDRELDTFRRWLGSHRFKASIRTIDDDLFEVVLEGFSPRATTTTSLTPEVTCRPMTTRSDRAVAVEGESVTVGFPGLSFQALTSFFVFTAKASRESEHRELQFVVNAELVGAPEDRRQRILASLLKNREELLRFLLMLLSGMGESGQMAEAALGAGKWAWAWSAESTALFEPMVRALARDPSKIDEIGSIMEELSKTADGRSILPEGWEDVWEPIRTAREALRS